MCCSIFTHAQIISNLEWSYLDGTAEPYSVSKSKADNSTNVIAIATKVVPGEDANISIIKFNRDGDIIWQQSFNGASNAKDYATNLVIDNQDNIYVSGATYDSTNNYDIVVLKYDSSGNLQFTMQYDGPAHGSDIGTAANIDNNGNIYVTGSATVTGNLTDFVTIKYDINGSLQWDSFYDYANLYEAPIDIKFNGSYSSIFVSGASATSNTNWDYVTVQYNTSGTQTNATRSSSAGIGFDKPMGFHIDSLNNIYITGSVVDSGTTTYNIKTMKLDSALNILWSKTYDEDGKDDQGNDLAVDAYGNVYVVGTINKATDSNNIAILKYNAAGDLIWKKDYGSRDSLSDDKGKEIFISGGHIFITGAFDEIGNFNIGTFQIDSGGNMMWCKFFDGEGNGYDSPTSLTVTSDDEVFVSGISYDGTTNKNITLKYSLLRIDSLVTLYDADSSKYVKGEVIVKFDPSVIDSNFADNINWQFASLSEIIPDSIVDNIATQIDYENAGDLHVVKIFDWMTKSDSLSIARNGDTIVMDKLWSTYRLLIPDGYSEEEVDTLLKSSSPEIVFTQLNFIFSAGGVPNDTYIYDQISLFPSAPLQEAHIHADGAWDIEVGKPFVKVGIIDGNIDFTNEDFGGGTLATSKVVNGEDFANNIPLAYVTNYSWHGTSCAGIIGALRNNSLGIAGLAGGDDLTNNKGASLISLGVDDNGNFPLSAVINAIVKGSVSTVGGIGYGCHILNNSYETDDEDFATLLAIKACFDNHCAFITIRGNRYSNESNGYNVKPAYPGCYRRDWVVNTGASGNDGHRKHLIPGIVNGDFHFESNYAHDVDVIAPGSMDIIATCQAGNATLGGGFVDGPFSPDNHYTHFNGTSAAAPHVSGLAAIMLSHHTVNDGYPNGLDDGDLQYLIKKYAQDLGNEGQVDVGHGLINAEETLKHIDINHGYWVQHVNNLNLTSSSVTTVNTAIPISLDGFYSNELSPYVIYTGNQILFTRTYSAILPSFAINPQIVDHWITHKSGAGSNPVGMSSDYHQDVSYSISGNVITTTVSTYSYEVTSSPSQVIFPYKYFPDVPAEISTDISFLLYDNTVNLHSSNLNNEESSFCIFPNPCDKYFSISKTSKLPTYVNIVIYNTFGQIVLNKKQLCLAGNDKRISTANLPNGVYQVIFESVNNKSASKLVVQH